MNSIHPAARESIAKRKYEDKDFLLKENASKAGASDDSLLQLKRAASLDSKRVKPSGSCPDFQSPANKGHNSNDDDLFGLLSEKDSVLKVKFNQQLPLVLKHSVFRHQQHGGITKQLHSRACELISSAAHYFNLSAGTMMLSIQLFDRAIALTPVRKTEITLVAITCLFLAAKIEEVHPPYGEELVNYCQKKIEKEHIFEMEQVLFTLFQGNIALPTRYDFAQRFAEQARLTTREKAMTQLLLELSHTDYNLNYYLPSHVAAGAIHLTRQMLRSGSAPVWPQDLAAFTRCEEAQLVDIVTRLRAVHWHLENNAMRNILQRYTSETLHYGLSDTTALPYSQLRFDSLKVPRQEPELVDYCVCIPSAAPAASSNSASMVRTASLNHGSQQSSGFAVANSQANIQQAPHRGASSFLSDSGDSRDTRDTHSSLLGTQFSASNCAGVPPGAQPATMKNVLSKLR